MAKKEAMFRTKNAILRANEENGVDISAISNVKDFMDAGLDETLGVIIESGSDYKVVEVKRIKYDKKAFLELIFGATQKQPTG